MDLRKRLLTSFILLGIAAPAMAQTVVYSPLVPAPLPRVVVQRPIVAAPPSFPMASPVVVRRPVISYAPTTVWSPAVVTTYRPVTPTEPPVAIAGPAGFTANQYAQPVGVVPLARPVVVRTKVYVPGQPIRNLLKAVTP